jgi:hypothetical protein
MKKRHPDENRLLHFAIRCSKEELDAIRQIASETTCRSFSEYARKMLMGKPIEMVIRNVSLDAMIDMINEVRRQLEKLMEYRTLGAEDKARLGSLLSELQLIFNTIANQCIPK